MGGSPVVPCPCERRSALLDIKARSRVGRAVSPLIRGLARLGITPTTVTLVGLLVTVAGAVVVGFGHPTAGALVVTVGVLLDVVDGPLARATGTAGARGALVDTVSDRVGELAIWAGVAYFVAPDPLRVTLCVTGLGVSMLVPFVRAKAEAAGLDGRGGWMGRAERLILLLAGLFFAGLGAPVLDATLWAVTVLVAATVGQRFRATWTQLDG